MGSSGGKSVSTIEKADPWSGQQPYLTDIFEQAKQQYYGGQPQYYPGETVAPIDPNTQYAQNYAEQAAQGQLKDVSKAAGQSAVFNLRDAKDVQSNPYLQSAISAAFTPTIQAFTDPGGALSQARTQFEGAGQFGSSRHALGEGVAYGRLGTALANTASTMASEGYTSGLDAAIRQAALLPQTQTGILAPASTAEAVGQSREAYAQQLIDAAINEWNFNQNLPAAKLAQYQNLVQGTYGGDSITTSPAARSNPALGAIGGAATGAVGGAAVGAQMGSSGGVYGAAIGAIIGAIAGYAGSR